MKSFPEVARHLTILKKEDVKLHAVVPRGLVHLRQQELIPGRNLLKVRGRGTSQEHQEPWRMELKLEGLSWLWGG